MPADREPPRAGMSGGFPATSVSAVRALRSADADERTRAFATIAAAYWKPAYAYVRLRWRLNDDDARDAVQGFLTEAFAREWLGRYDPERAAFRTFLRACLDAFVQGEARAARRVKRGGAVTTVAFDFAAAEEELQHLAPPAPDDVELWFEREWLRHLYQSAVADVERRCAAAGKPLAWRLFAAHDVARTATSYAESAAAEATSVSQVTNALHWARREFRERLLARLRALTASDDEFRAEARRVLGATPPAPS